MKKKIVLGSTSCYRAQLLNRLGLSFISASPATDETALVGEAPEATALRLAIGKAKSLRSMFENALVIGADQVADFDGLAIGKPLTRSAAIDQLQRMAGNTLQFHSGIALLNTLTGHIQSRNVTTTVRYRQYSRREIENYLDREDALDCAGSAKAEGLGISLIASMQSDDPTAIIGLPLIALVDMLQAEDIVVLE
ncbi:MAG: Maf family nucleotide pyrophosphatase [Betaproteobacteria bacterium]